MLNHLFCYKNVCEQVLLLNNYVNQSFFQKLVVLLVCVFTKEEK